MITTYQGNEVVPLVKTNHPDFIMLDVMLPEMKRTGHLQGAERRSRKPARFRSFF